MNEEIMNNEIEEIENTEVETETTVEPEDSKGNGLAGLIVTGLVVLGGVALYKSRHKIKAWKDKKAIKRLEKRGYVVNNPNEVAESIEVVTEEVAEEIEE